MFILAIVPQLGLGLNFQGLLGAAMILLFGFLFVTVSSRLTGEVGSSSNPISGMTIATLLLVCLIFFILGRTGPTAMLTALDRGGGGVHRVLQRRHHVARLEDRLPGRRDAVETAVGDPDRRGHVGAGHRRDDARPEPGRVALHEEGIPDERCAEADPEPPPPREVPASRTIATNRPPRAGRAGPRTRTQYRVVHVRDGDHEGVPAGRYLVNDER